MAEIAFWTFDDQAGPETGFVNDSSPHGGQMPLPAGKSVKLPQNPARSDSEATAVLTQGPGTIKFQYNLSDLPQDGSVTILRGDFANGGAMRFSLTSEGGLRASRETAEQDLHFGTPDGFADAGDALRVTFSWAPGDGGGEYTVENLSTGTFHSVPVPETLVMDIGWHDLDSWSFEAGGQGAMGSAGETGPAVVGKIGFVAIYDDVVPAGPVPGDDERSMQDAGEPGDDTAAGSGSGEEAALAGGADDGWGTVTLTYEGGNTGSANTLGYYIVDPENGQITGAGIAFQDARPEFGSGDLIPGVSQTDFGVPLGARVGTFLIADGNMRNDFDALGEGALHFLNAAGRPATLNDPAPQLVHVATDGARTVLEGEIWHSAGHSDALALNSDGCVHVQGISDNSDGTWTFGYAETREKSVHGDFDDVIFTVDLGQTGAWFLNPDYYAHAPLGTEEEADGHTLFGDEAEDLGYDDEASETVAGGADDSTPPEPSGETSDKGGLAAPAVKTEDGTVSSDDAEPKFSLLSSTDDSKNDDPKDDDKIVPCFTPGTLIDTDEGRIPVEELFVGDRVLTRDRGFRRLVWVGHKEVTPELLAARPEFAPVHIARGALDNQLPERDMMVSPQHRMLLSGSHAQLLFGEGEVLVAARHLIGLPGVTRAHDRPVTYIHVMCDRHEILRADGCWSESFQPGDLSIAGLDDDQREELLALFPELAEVQGQRSYAAARMTLKAHEARVLIGV